jgi:hypothetical protein
MDTTENPIHNVINTTSVAEVTPPKEVVNTSGLPPATESAPEEKRQELFSEQFQRLAREKRQLEKARAELKQQEKEYRSYKERESKFKEDPNTLLEHYGWDFESLQQALVEGKRPESLKLRELERKIAQQDELRKAEEKAKVDAETKRQWEGYTASIAQQIKAQSEKYELINAEEVYAEVPSLMLKYHDEFGETLTWQQAADMIEKELEDQLLNRGEKYKKIKKLSKLFEIQQEAKNDQNSEKSESQKIIEQLTKESKPSFPKSTLTNDLATSSTPAPRKFSSRDEEVREAAKILGA